MNPPPPEPEPSLKPRVAPKRAATLVFAGDLIFSKHVQRNFSGARMSLLFGQVQDILQSAHLTVVNMEGCLSNRGTPANKEYTFRASPQWAAVLRRSGIRVCTVANNHAMDYGAEALTDTLRHLRDAGIHPIGGGANWREATSPLLIGANGTLFALFGFTDIVPPRSMALADRSGVSALRDFGALRWQDTVRQHLEQLAPSEAIKIAVVHWGEEGKFVPSKKQRQRAGQLMDLGFDVVVGHHPHVIQGIEARNGKLIAYSLGNFVHTPAATWQRRGALLLVSAEPGRLVGAQVIPIELAGGVPKPATYKVRTQILHRLRHLSRSMGTAIAQDGKVGAGW